jgi:peptidoglycan/LPS O-acetylase OafA/YrhL
VTTDLRSVPGPPAPERPASPRPAARRFLPEVQGLRAVAVLLVLVYHLDKDLLPGGYAGVDVFFVISGFLITTLLLREADTRGRVSLAGFYVRRVRRILPAATLVLLATGVAAFLLLPSPRLLDTARQLIASAAYVENFYLATESVDYLAAETAASPVQHYWSLAVEEQFYLVWPLLFVGWAALGARRTRTLLAAAAAVLVASFTCSVVMTASDPQPSYFLPQTRMWELAVGGVLAIVLARRALPAGLRRVLGWAGLAAIIAAVVGFDDATAFPGWAAAVPVLGAAAVIAAGHSDTRWSAYGLLASAPARFVGDISYALYLWHWPVIVFALSVTDRDSLTPAAAVGAAALSVALAWGTKVLVEDPVRDGGLLRAGRAATAFALSATLVVTSVGAAQYLRYQWLRGVEFDPAVHVGPQAIGDERPEGDPDERIYPPPVGAEEDLPSVYDDDCQASNAEVTPDPCVYGPDDAETVIAVVGDSHAAHWVPALRSLAGERNWLLYSYTKSSCAFTDTLTVTADAPYPECPEWNAAVTDELVQTVRPDVVFTSSHSRTDAVGAADDEEGRAAIADGMARMWSVLEEAGTDVVAIRDTPVTRPRIPECVDRHPDALDACASPREDAVRDDPQVRAVESGGTGADLVDLTDDFCTDDSCPPVVGNVLIYRDSHHLTATYSRLLAPALEEAAADVLDDQ